MKITPIKLRRINAGLETNDAVEALDISRSTFYKIEQGHGKPSSKLIAKMAKTYGCTIDSIYKDLKI